MPLVLYPHSFGRMVCVDTRCDSNGSSMCTGMVHNSNPAVTQFRESSGSYQWRFLGEVEFTEN